MRTVAALVVALAASTPAVAQTALETARFLMGGDAVEQVDDCRYRLTAADGRVTTLDFGKVSSGTPVTGARAGTIDFALRGSAGVACTRNGACTDEYRLPAIRPDMAQRLVNAYGHMAWTFCKGPAF